MKKETKEDKTISDLTAELVSECLKNNMTKFEMFFRKTKSAGCIEVKVEINDTGGGFIDFLEKLRK